MTDIATGPGIPLPLVVFDHAPAMPGIAAEAIDRLPSLGPSRSTRVVGAHRRFAEDGWRGAAETRRILALPPGHAPSGDVPARSGT
ncbi:hypothetical protein [Ensifer soli]|uniref:hypothetical protein n=1 Tax=Ciceribacter sp. sgz301302 TaxID=3342379 RepID=UPI0035B85ECD